MCANLLLERGEVEKAQHCLGRAITVLSSPTLDSENISKAVTSCDSLQRVNLVFTGRGYLSSDRRLLITGRRVTREFRDTNLCPRG